MPEDPESNLYVTPLDKYEARLVIPKPENLKEWEVQYLEDWISLILRSVKRRAKKEQDSIGQ